MNDDDTVVPLDASLGEVLAKMAMALSALAVVTEALVKDQKGVAVEHQRHAAKAVDDLTAIFMRALEKHEAPLE